MEWDSNEAAEVSWKQQKKDCERGKMENIGSWELPMVLLKVGLKVTSLRPYSKAPKMILCSSKFILLFKQTSHKPSIEIVVVLSIM